MYRQTPFDPKTVLLGKKVVVIGGSSGIGLEIARQARDAGADLVIVGRDAGKLERAVRTLGKGAATVVGDAHDHARLGQMFDTFQDFDHLVSLIGDTMAGGYFEVPLDVMRHVVESKFWTNLLIGRKAAPRTRDGGSITFTAGTGVRAQEASASYTANLGLAGMAEGMAYELAPRVRVNVVAPTLMDTALWSKEDRAPFEERLRAYADQTPMKRLGSPEEAAHAYLFLMQNTFMTGQFLKIDGGAMLRR
jgi:NAD(P)-dependent dehydrogenase (short-subunit alcohol dehydrogenase family)